MGRLLGPGSLKRSGLSLAIALGLVVGSIGPSTASIAQARELASPDASELAALLVGERDSAVTVELAAFLTRELGATETRELAALLASTLPSPLEQHGATPVATTSTGTITTGTGLGSLTTPATCCTPDQVQQAQSIINARAALAFYVSVGFLPVGFGIIILRGLVIQAARLPQPLQALVLGYIFGSIGSL